MSKVKITFPDNNSREFSAGVTGADIAKAIGAKLAKDALAIKVNGIAQDLNDAIIKDAKIEILTFDSKEGKEVFWHSASHLMTQAVLRVFKGQNIGLGVGAAVENGFYQDYGMKPISDSDFEKIENEMKKIVNEKLEIKHENRPKKKVLEFYKNDPYKIELTNAVPDDMVSVYTQGEFDNLCKGPHVPNTSYLKAFKLMKVAGAYWRGDSKNEMLQRIYGVAFPEEKQLKDYLHVMEEAEKRNHVKLGKEHDLFSMQDFAPGCVFFHPKGMIIINELMKYWHEEHHKAGYHEVSTPLILKKDLWLTSGHWDHYKNNMYFTKIDDEEFAVKPMNCPGGILVYKNRRHSYRELPLRLAEVGIVHRHELSGVLNGCFRVRKFSQDDAHIFCMEDQIQKEVSDLIGLIDKMYKTVGFKEYHLELSTRPEKAMGSKAMWDNAEKALKKALDSKAIKYKINEGDGAFYGPKIDFHIKDAIGRTWQCGTIQLDFQMPEKFELEYIAADDKAHRPVMLHRVIYGSLERFFGILIEHYAAAFPLWLSPEQVRVISVSDPSNEYSEKVNKELFDAGLRSNTDLRTETVSYKIRDAQLAKVPYMVVIGEKEVQNKTIAVRDRATGKTEYGIKLADFREKLLKEIEAKK